MNVMKGSGTEGFPSWSSSEGGGVEGGGGPWTVDGEVRVQRQGGGERKGQGRGGFQSIPISNPN